MFFHKLKKIIILVFGLTLLLTASVISYGYVRRVPEIYGFFNPSDQNEKLIEDLQHRDQEELKGIQPLAVEAIKIDNDSTIVLERFYTSCNHMLTEEHPMENRYIGKTEEELIKIFSDWELKRFTPEKVVFMMEIDSYCADHYIIKQEEGLVVIFRPDKDTGLLLVLEATDIPYDRLRPEIQQEITQGIVVDSIEGVEQLIENWGS